MDGALKDAQQAIGEAQARLAKFEKEKEFYTKTKMPAKLQQDIKGADFDIVTQQDLLAKKKREVEQINGRYDDDKKRYSELTKKGK